MQFDEKESPPVIVNKKAHHASHHGGAWKVAYADFVTAMMALFIVLWVLGQDEQTIEAVARYFKDPIGFSEKGSSFLEGKVTPFLAGDTGGKDKVSEANELKRMGEKIISELSASPEFQKLTDHIEIEIVDEGLRIEIIDSSDIFFEIGTSTLKPNAKHLLEKVGNNLAKLKNKVVLEGHTDSRPYSNRTGYTNYELSADRANSARAALTLSDMKEDQIDEIRGYADKRLRDKNDPFNKINRRISIIVKFSGDKNEKENNNDGN
jgi:chemotaxis protein MotB